jgi:predicted RNase H-like HicB family nuclease
MMKLKQMNLTAVFLEVPEGGYSAYIEEIPGANSQGDTLEEAKLNLGEALRMVLETNCTATQ